MTHRAGSDTGDSGGDSPRASAAARVLGHLLWMAIPVGSFGVLAWVPAVQTWWRARSAGWALTTALLAVGSVVILLGMADVFTSSSFLGMVAIGTAVGGTAAAATGRRIAFAPPTDPRQGIDPAILGVLESRERRDEARRIAQEDPAMAAELRIGRPDLSRTYDDGGLIDLNNAGAPVLADALGWPLPRAEAFVAERDRREGYESLTELTAMSAITPRVLDAVADRAVLLPYAR